MASTASPYGLKAVNELGGLPYSGSTRQFLIDPAGTTPNMYNGTVVAIGTGGYIAAVTNVGGTADAFPAGVVGVFNGCSYVNAQGQQIFSQYYPTGVTGVITANVIDDDRAVFQVQSAGSLAQAALGGNVDFFAAQTGSTSTGNSTTAVTATSAADAASPFRIVGFVTIGDAKTDVLVKFNVGVHSYSKALGVA